MNTGITSRGPKRLHISMMKSSRIVILFMLLLAGETSAEVILRNSQLFVARNGLCYVGTKHLCSPSVLSTLK